MNKRLSQILLLALIVAAAGSYFVYRIAGNQMNAAAQAHTTKIVVAARNLEIGTLIRDTDIKLGEWVGAAPKGSLTMEKLVVNRGVISALYEGEPVLESRLAAAGSGGGMAATIRPGMRACAVKVDEVVGVSGFVTAGMRVDVLVSGTPPGASASAGPRVMTALQNIEVLSAGTNLQKDNEGKPVQVPVVNLLVTPEQAEILSLASSQTHIQLVLRNPLDNDTTKTSGAAMAGLFGEGGAPAAPKGKGAVVRPRPPVIAAPVNVPPPPRVFLVQIMNGPKRSEEKFAAPNSTAPDQN